MTSWPERLSATGPKRILSIDGGGVRGALAVGILRKIETLLRERSGRPDMVLADYFDLIGGTSTGAIIAAGLALGRDTDDMERLYRTLGPRVFGQKLPRVPFIQARFDPAKLQKVLIEELGDASLGSAAWKTGFAAVAKRVDTGSAWLLTNNPKARYWDGDPDEVAREPDPAKRVIVPNRDYRLAQVVQASAAAPFFFDLVQVEVERGKPGVFFDGGITPHNNPSLQLAIAALAPPFGFGWSAGADELLIVSVGTGAPRPVQPNWVGRRLLAIWKAMHALMSMGFDSSQLAIETLQWLGTSPQPWRISSEIGGLENARPAGIAPLWTFVRYDAPLERTWLDQELEYRPDDKVLPRLHALDDYRQIPELFQVGLKAGERLVRSDHFPAVFDPP